MNEKTSILTTEIIISIVIVLMAIVIYFIAKRIVNKIMERSKKTTKKGRTYIKLFNNILKYALIIVTVVAILQVNGINVTSIITGLGIASAIFALALQDAVKDIIAGVNIIVDGYFIVGDVLKIGDIEGKVIELGLKSTKLRDLNTGDLLTISNRNISQALIEPDYFFITIPISYDEKIARVDTIMEGIVDRIKIVGNVSEVEYKGLSKFDSSAINYTIKVFTKADLKIQVRYKANRIIKEELDKNNIEIPYMQVDIHNK